jgi:hypothetical protein
MRLSLQATVVLLQAWSVTKVPTRRSTGKKGTKAVSEHGLAVVARARMAAMREKGWRCALQKAFIALQTFPPRSFA